MAAVYPTPAQPRTRAAPAALWPLLCALLLTLAVTTVRLTGGVDSDVASQLQIAQRIHEGARLYRDIVEVNPPLWFWMALPIDRLAALLHIGTTKVMIAAFGVLVTLSLSATDRLPRPIAPLRRAMLLAYGAMILAALPWMHVGQREQI